jgi:hypothetical protein
MAARQTKIARHPAASITPWPSKGAKRGHDDEDRHDEGHDPRHVAPGECRSRTIARVTVLRRGGAQALQHPPQQHDGRSRMDRIDSKHPSP